MTDQEKLARAKQLLENADSFAGCCMRMDGQDAYILADYVEKALKILNQGEQDERV